MAARDLTVTERLKRIIEVQRKRLDRMSTQEARRLYKAIEQAIADLEHRLRALKREDIYTAQQHRLYLTQLYQMRDRLRQIVQAHIDEAQRRAQEQAKEDVVQKLKALDPEFRLAGAPVSAEQVGGLLQQQSKLREVQRLRAEAIAKRYSEAMIGSIEQRLAHALLIGEGTDETIRALADMTKQEYWKGERLVRTELSFAYNTSQRAVLDEMAKEDPSLWIQWHEHASGPAWGGPDNKAWPGMATPLDDRVAEDSRRLHGQLRRPGEYFVDPVTGKQYYSPPNRPNDRATLILVRVQGKHAEGRS